MLDLTSIVLILNAVLISATWNIRITSVLNDFHLGQQNPISASVTTVKFYSYTKANSTVQSEIKIGNAKSLKKAGLVAEKDVRIIVHGFSSSVNSTNEPCRILAPEYLAEGIPNLICVDWAKLSANGLQTPFNLLFYIKVFHLNAPKVGRRIAEFIIFLVKNKIIADPSRVHILGHSLGAHVAGIAGAMVKNFTGKSVGRITGLDPAGPFLELIGTNGKLKKSDASFVDVIHTDSTFLGSTLSFGHADFFANGGRGQDQPNCLGHAILGVGVTALGCGHSSASTYYGRTIRGEQLVGCECMKNLHYELLKLTCGRPPNSTCSNSALFGEHGLRTAQGNYYLSVPLSSSS